MTFPPSSYPLRAAFWRLDAAVVQGTVVLAVLAALDMEYARSLLPFVVVLFVFSLHRMYWFSTYELRIDSAGVRQTAPRRTLLNHFNGEISWADAEEAYGTSELHGSWMAGWLWGGPVKLRGKGQYATLYPTAYGQKACEHLEVELLRRGLLSEDD